MKLWKSGFFRFPKKPPYAPINGGGPPPPVIDGQLSSFKLGLLGLRPPYGGVRLPVAILLTLGQE